MSEVQSAPALPAAAVAALRRGNKIEAIKIVRAELNIGLKEAKDMVDAMPTPRDYGSGDSPLMRGDAGGSGKWWWIVISIAIAIGVYYWWK